MKIEMTTLKRIASKQPELTLAQFVAVWGEKLDDDNRARDRERHRKQPENERNEDGNARNEPRTYEQQEGELYAFAKQICGARAGGLVTDLLKQNGRDLAAVRAVLERARKTDDPKAFLAGNIRKHGNGARNSTMAAVDDLIDRAEGGAGGRNAEMVDITPGRA